MKFILLTSYPSGQSVLVNLEQVEMVVPCKQDYNLDETFTKVYCSHRVTDVIESVEDIYRLVGGESDNV